MDLCNMLLRITPSLIVHLPLMTPHRSFMVGGRQDSRHQRRIMCSVDSDAVFSFHVLSRCHTVTQQENLHGCPLFLPVRGESYRSYVM